MFKHDDVIAVDGPSGSGKSTVARLVSERLKLIYIDTGSMFRAVGYGLKDLKIDWSRSDLSPKDEKTVADFFNQHEFSYAPRAGVLIELDHADLTKIIRQHEVSHLASQVSRYMVIRSYLADWQRKIVQGRPAILDGRDIGTVIFPRALLKIFLTASAEERAKRRFEELKDSSVSYESILKDIKERDLQDTQRVLAPLKKAPDALEVDTTHMKLHEIVDLICSEWNKRRKV
jgi:CMP/dCMP kinase